MSSFELKFIKLLFLSFKFMLDVGNSIKMFQLMSWKGVDSSVLNFAQPWPLEIFKDGEPESGTQI